MRTVSLENLAKQNLDRWKARGRKTTHYTCPHCNEKIEVRKPEPNMVPSRGFWQKVKECYLCHGLSVVRTWPCGKTDVE